MCNTWYTEDRKQEQNMGFIFRIRSRPPSLFVVYSEQNNTMGEDLRLMLCADALTMAKSTLVDLVAFHTNADQLYAGTECSSKLRGVATARPKAKVCHDS